jgi:hypothetical protein
MLRRETATFGNRAVCSFTNIKFETARSGEIGYRNQACPAPIEVIVKSRKGTIIKRTALALIAPGIVGVTALASPSPAEARWRGGWGPGIAGGVIGAAVIGGLASSA